MRKKVATLFLIVFVGGLFLPQITLAGEYKLADGTPVCYEGLVPCGKEVMVGGTWQNGKCVGGTPKLVYCQFCHFFVMIDGIFDFVLTYIVPPIAVLMIVVGGIMFYFAGGNPELLSRGKSLIKSVIIGLFIVYGSFMIVGFLLNVVGAADRNPIKEVWQNGVFTINCPMWRCEIFYPGYSCIPKGSKKEAENADCKTGKVCGGQYCCGTGPIYCCPSR